MQKILGLAIWMSCLCCLWIPAACTSSAPTTRGQVKGVNYSSQEWLQSERNRLTSMTMHANQDSLMLLAEKLYRRNPQEWQKTANSLPEALALLGQSIQGGQVWPPLEGHHDVDALSRALAPEFKGDRVAAFTAACMDVIFTAHGGKKEFYYLDSVDPQHVYNAARNMEIALWILSTRQTETGQPLLLSNEISSTARNLSFEREFGKIIGRLDLLAISTSEQHRRTAINTVQGWALNPMLTFFPVR